MSADKLASILREMEVAGSREVCQRLGISQPTFSRLVRRLGDRVLRVGRARATRYALRRTIDGVPSPIPVIEVRPDGGTRRLVELQPIGTRGFYIESRCEDADSGFTPDVPWFLSSVYPTGFLGRMAPRRHPELGLPPDIQRWTGDHALRFACTVGADLTGALIVGDRAMQRFIERRLAPRPGIENSARRTRYTAIAGDVLRLGPVGSSAAGEQPKFMAIRVRSGPKPALVKSVLVKPVLVKFSPPLADAVSQRIADLLVVEHVAHQVLAACGHRSASSEILAAGGRVFLEVERFDRTPEGGRLGQVDLMALDAEFVGSEQRSWSESCEMLARAGVVPPELARTVRWRERFGHLIANTDMHFGNLSFTLSGTRVTGLAPCYDMLPMAYMPRHSEVTPHVFAPPLPRLADEDIARSVHAAATGFWEQVAGHPRVSTGFRGIASANAETLRGQAAALAALPDG